MKENVNTNIKVHVTVNNIIRNLLQNIVNEVFSQAKWLTILCQPVTLADFTVTNGAQRVIFIKHTIINMQIKINLLKTNLTPPIAFLQPVSEPFETSNLSNLKTTFIKQFCLSHCAHKHFF